MLDSPTGDIGLGNPLRVKKNTNIWLNWFWNDTYLRKYRKKVGFTEDQTCWPKKEQGDDMLDKGGHH